MHPVKGSVRLASRLMMCVIAVAALGVSSSVRAQVAERVAAPDFDLAQVMGGSMNSGDLKGYVVVVDFIATWCPPCIDELPTYRALFEKYKGKNVRVIGIVLESGSLDEVKAKIAPLGVPYPVLFGAEKTTSDFGVYAFPATLILTKDWTIHREHTEVLPNKKQLIEQEIDELLLEPGNRQRATIRGGEKGAS